MARISNSVFIDGVAKFKKNLVKIKKRVGKLFRSCVSSDQDDHFDLASPFIRPWYPGERPDVIEHIDAKVLDQPATDDPTVVDTDAEVLDKPAANDQESVPELKVIWHLYNVNSNPEIDEVEKIMFSASAIKRKLARFTLSSFFKKQIISIALNYFTVEFICSV